MKRFTWLHCVRQLLVGQLVAGQLSVGRLLRMGGITVQGRKLSANWLECLANQIRQVTQSTPRRSTKARRVKAWAVFAEHLEVRTLPAFVIVPTFDSSITNDANAATIEASINRVLAAYENTFSNNITVHITFQKGGGLGGSSTFYDTVSYSAYHAALIANASSTDDATALATLPSGSNQPIAGTASNTNVDITTALERALGLSSSGPPTDSTITLNTSLMNLDRTSAQNPSKYDLMAVTAHELDEALGFGSGLDGASNGDPISGLTIEAADLFRYASTGVRSFNTSAASQAYFSIDGGTTKLARYNQTEGGDFGDWYSPGGQTPQVQDAYGTPGSTPNLNVELRRTDVVGYTRIAPVTLNLTAPVSQIASGGVSTAFNLGSITNGNGPFGVTVNWGDGSQNTTFFVNGTGALGTRNHTYATDGSYTPSISITDFTSQTGSTSFSVTAGTAGTAQITTSTTAVNEGGGSKSVAISLTGAGILLHNATVAVNATNGTASAGSDYTLSTALVTFPAGTDLSTNPTQNVTFILQNDTLIEGPENFTISLGTITVNSDKITAGTVTSNVVTITDNDSATVSIGSSTSVTEGGGTSNLVATLHVTTDGVAGGNATLASTVTANLSGNGDYSSVAASFTAGAGNNATANIKVSATQDTLIEGTETFANQTLTLTGNATVSGSGQTITVNDDDTATVSIAMILDGAEKNSPTNGKFRVTQTGISSTDTVVNYLVSGTAKSGVGNDYTTLSGTVTILANQTTADVDVAVLNDALVEGTETVILTLSGLGSHNSGITLDPVSANLTATLSITDDDTATVSIAKITDGTEANSPTSRKFRVTQTAVSATDTVVNYSVAGTATPGASNDYSTLTGTVTILAGQTTADIDVTVLNDALVEGTETVVLTLTSFGSHDSDITLDALPAKRTATVNITDDDTATVSIAKVVDGAEAIVPTNGQFRVTQTAVSSTDTVVNYSIFGTATPVADYTILSGTVTIPAGQTTADINVAVLNDNLLEGTEAVILTLSGFGAHDTDITLDAIQANRTATVNIIDDDTATVSIAKVTDGAEANSPTNGKFRVTQTVVSLTDTVVNYSISGTATPGSGNDYATLNGTATILAGQTTTDIDVSVLNDAIVEGTETVSLTLTGLGNHSPGVVVDSIPTHLTATVNITDDDAATVSVAKIAYGAEGNTPTNGKFRVTQTAVSSTDTVLNYSVAGTAVPGPGNDYTALTGTVTILAGQTTADIDVAVLNDALVEGNETVLLTLTSFGSHDSDITLDPVSANQTATVNIADDDTATISIAKVTDGAEGNSPSNGKFRVTLTTASATDTVVNYSISGTATPGAGNDYSSLTGTVTVFAGQTTADIDVAVLNDILVEGTETVSLTISGLGAHNPGVSLDPIPAKLTSTVNILDDDTATISIEKITDGAEANTPSNGQFRVTQTAISSTNTVVDYAISGTATPGTGNDYVPLTGTVTILAGQTSADIDVAVLNDTLVESTETVVLTLTGFGSSSPGITLDPIAPNRNATVSITDDDTATVSIVKITDGAEGITPSNGKFQVTQTAASTTDTEVNYSVFGTATPGAGHDYTTLTGTVTILAGQTTADIDVAVLNDFLVEGTETVGLTLSGLGSHNADITLDAVPANLTSVADILDDDTAAVSIAKITDGAESETPSNGKFRVTQTGVSVTDTVVNYSVAGTAIPGTGNDYTTLSGTVTIPAGQTTADIDVNVLNDAIVEGTETVIPMLTGFSGRTAGITLDTIPANLTATVNITDDDTATVSIAKVSDGAEANTPTNGKFRVTQTAVSAMDTVVNYSISGTATSGAGNDYSTLSGTVTIPAGQTTADIVVQVLNDALVEGTETVSPTLIGFGSHSAGITLDAVPANLTAAVSITDDDTATIAITKITDGAEANTPTNGKFRVTQTAVSATDTVVNYSVSGTASAGDDYSTLTGTVTIPAGQTTADIDVAVLNDALVEGSETVVPTLTSFGSHNPSITFDSVPAHLTATVFILDDDTATVSIVKLTDGAETDSPTDGTFRVTQTGISATDTVVNYAISGTATPGANNDYLPLTGTVTIPAGQTTSDIDVSVLNDDLVEGTETVALMLTGFDMHTAGISFDPVSSNLAATVNITDDDPLTITSPDKVIEPENTSVSDTIIDVTANNLPGSTLTFSLSGPDSARFNLNSETGEITFATSPDYEAPLDQGADNFYHVTVTVNDDTLPAHSASQDVAISITNVNEMPSNVELSTATVAENQPIATVIGSFATTDQDAGDTFTYSLVDGEGDTDNAFFQIAGNTLQSNSFFDYEARSSYNVRIRSTDAGGLSTEKAMTISITDVNDPPTVKLTAGSSITLSGKTIAVDSGALVQDQDTTNLKDNRVVVTIKQGFQTPDLLHLIANGKGTDKLKVAGGLLKLGKTTLGTVTGGKKGQPMTLTFTSDVTAELVTRVVRSIGFQSHKANPGVRIIDFQAFDGSGTNNPAASKTVVVGNP